MKDSEEYFNNIYAAEAHLLKYEFDFAYTKYFDAFDSSETPFLKDVYNAFICGIKLKDEFKITNALRLLSTYNLDTNWVRKSYYSEYFDQMKMQTHVINNNDQHFKSYHMDKIDSLYNVDQELRIECKKVNLNYNAVCKDTLQNLDSMNLIYLMHLFEKNGFPDDRYFQKNIPGNFQRYQYILSHNASWGNYAFENILTQGMERLTYHPQLFADLMSTKQDESKPNYGTGYSIILGDSLYVFKLHNNELLSEIDSIRKSISLDSLDQHLKKVEFQFFNSEFRLIYPALLARVKTDKETEELLSDKWRPNRIDRYVPPNK